MIEKISYFTASYRDGRVYLGGKGKDAGYYAAQLLNEYDKDEFAARLAMFRMENLNTAKQLRTGFLDIDTYIKAGNEIKFILSLLPKLRPFSELDIQGELGRIEELFTEQTAEFPLQRMATHIQTMSYFSRHIDFCCFSCCLRT